MASQSGLVIWTKDTDPASGGNAFVVNPRHYEELKKMKDEKMDGWIELDHVHGDGKVFIRVESITDMLLATESYCQSKDSWDAVNGTGT